MARHFDLLRLAANTAIQPPSKVVKDHRLFLLGAVGVRNDGTVVFSRNGAVRTDTPRAFPAAHAETRLLRKMDRGGIVYVARVSKIDGRMLMARPCKDCMAVLKAHKIRKIYYSISEIEYGTTDSDVK